MYDTCILSGGWGIYEDSGVYIVVSEWIINEIDPTFSDCSWRRSAGR